MSDIDQFETLLQTHFKTLAEEKRLTGQKMFVLEHCLDESAVREMREALRADIQINGMNSQFKHCWLVHASEHGYTFDGLEYWQSFAELTPQWDYYGDRDTLRRWFNEFAKLYNGARPVGQWAEHYRFIAWPITHALLPTDLQVRLAETLYRLRYHLDEFIRQGDASVGSMLGRYVECPSTRFKHFLEQHELAGRVVRALLQDTTDKPLIYLPTLERITNDLNAKNQARAWLHDARKHFNRSQAKFIASGAKFSLAQSSHEQEDQSVHSEMDEHGVLLRPQMELRRTIESKWEVQLLVPCFQALVNLKPNIREHLARTRFTIPAHGNALFLGRSLLSGRFVPRKLIMWPRDGTPLLKFNVANEFFDRIIDAECKLPPANLWVFHCGTKDLASYVNGRHVRGGQTYLLLSRNPNDLAYLGNPIELDCVGISAVLFKAPEIVDSKLVELLNRVDISVQSTMQIEPVGLRPRQWSDTGIGEWLSTETPLLALRCDLEMQVYQVELGQVSQFEISCEAGVKPTLIALKDLGVGHHHVSISAVAIQKTPFGFQRKCVASAEVDVYIRHPTSWVPRMLHSGAMIVDVDPPVPSLEDFLKQRLQLRAEGDASRTATCSLILTNPASHEVSFEKILSHRLPISPEFWRSQLHEFLKQFDEQQLHNASEATILVEAEDIGEVRIPLRVEQEPLRWALRRSKSGTTLLLVDEGVQDTVSVTFYEFNHPLFGKAVDTQLAIEGINCKSKAGLYVAKAGGLSSSIAIASEERAQGLAALGAQVNRTELSTQYSIAQLLEYLKLWGDARTATYMATLKQQSVLTAIRSRLIELVCGCPWLRLEKAYDKDASANNWRGLENGVGQHASFAIALTSTWCNHPSNNTLDPFQCLETISKRFKICYDQGLIELAWQFASNPIDTDIEYFSSAMDCDNFPTLVRGARLLLLCSNKNREAN